MYFFYITPSIKSKNEEELIYSCYEVICSLHAIDATVSCNSAEESLSKK